MTRTRIAPPRVTDLGTTWDCIYFGQYNQSSEDVKSPLKWRILSIEDDKALILANQLIESGRVYHEEKTEITWENCTMRKYLNEEFLSEAFTEEERSAILQTTLKNKDNQKWSTPGGNDTEDNIFLLSIEDMLNKDYGFTGGDTRTAIISAHAAAAKSDEYEAGDATWWWLRSSGFTPVDAAYVRNNGLINQSGYFVNHNILGVRPALYIDLTKTPDLQYAGTVSA